MSATIDWDALLGSTEPPASTDPTDQNDNGNDDHPVSTFETPSPADDTGIPNTTPTDLGTVSTAPSPSLYDLTSTAIDSAPPTPPGQTGRPLTAEERLFQEQNPNGGSFTNPQAGVSVGGNGRPMTVEEQNASKQLPNGGSISATGVLSPNPAGPQLPNPGVGTASTSSTSGTASTGTTGSGSDRFVRDAQGNITGVKSENGYYDPNFQSVTNMENNYQRGDRMAGTVQGLELLAGAGNQDAAKILGADKRNGSNFMDSALEADWAKAHNAEIGNTVAGMTGKNANQAAADNLRGQLAPVNATPGTTGQDFPLAQQMMTDLEKVPGVQPNSVSMDKYGNVVFQDQGGIRHIPANEWADWAPVIAGKVAGADTSNTTTTGNGGGNGRNTGGGTGRGSGGGNGAGNAAAGARTPFDSQAHRDTFTEEANRQSGKNQRSLVDSLFGSGNPNGGPPSGSYTPPGPGPSFGDVAGDVGNFAGNVARGGIDLAQIAAAGPQAVGSAVGNAISNYLPQQGEDLGGPQGVNITAPNTIEQWIEAARRKGIIQ